MDDLDFDATELYPDGDILGRHSNAGDCRTTLCPISGRVGFRSDLVWDSVHNHDTDRLYDPAFWVQSVLDARHGATRNYTA